MTGCIYHDTGALATLATDGGWWDHLRTDWGGLPGVWMSDVSRSGISGDSDGNPRNSRNRRRISGDSDARGERLLSPHRES